MYPPGQSIIDALNTTMPTARFRSPHQWSMDALYTAIPTASLWSKPRHVTPQINHLREMSPVLRVSTHISRVSKEIDGKMFIGLLC